MRLHNKVAVINPKQILMFNDKGYFSELFHIALLALISSKIGEKGAVEED